MSRPATNGALTAPDIKPGDALAPVPEIFSSARLERVFADCFAARWRTVLLGGAAEPFYQPAGHGEELHRLYYRSDYFASALHEIAHWCIAGERRRLLPDFGYWYAPDGRNTVAQAAFEAVEAKPQALEWFFSQACGYRFFVSIDNLGAPGGMADCEPFRQRLIEEARAWRVQGLPQRAAIFLQALAVEFGTGLQAAKLDTSLAGLAG